MGRNSKKNRKFSGRRLRHWRWALLGPAVVLAAVLLWRPRAVPPPSTGSTEADLPVVVIDPGHGGEDGGTSGFGVQEKEAALDVATRLAGELTKRGVRPVLLRAGDAQLSLNERVEAANACRPLAFISVHFNFSTDSAEVRGVETYFTAAKEAAALLSLAETLHVPPDSPEIEATSRTLAEMIATHVSSRASTPDRGARNRPNLAVTRRTACPAVLVECAYLSHKPDATRAKTPAWRQALATGIAEGFVAWRKRPPAIAGALRSPGVTSSAP